MKMNRPINHEACPTWKLTTQDLNTLEQNFQTYQYFMRKSSLRILPENSSDILLFSKLNELSRNLQKSYSFYQIIS